MKRVGMMLMGDDLAAYQRVLKVLKDQHGPWISIGPIDVMRWLLGMACAMLDAQERDSESKEGDNVEDKPVA